ncbi:MAG: hypothetical protein HFI52_02325 [Lachnospiraceae bacterium]|nr:hypothetical protein [Lachnospiraceae bacterium]
MPFLVRKILKDESIEHIENIEDNDFLHQSADVPTTEFRTKHSTLSTYMIDNLNELDKAVLAIATTSSKISSMEFIILDAEILKAIGLKYENTYPGMEIPYEEMQEFHYDIVDVTIENLAKCLEAYKKTLQLDDNKSTFIVDYAEGKIKDLIKTALKQEKFNIEKVPVELNKAVQKLQKELH